MSEAGPPREPLRRRWHLGRGCLELADVWKELRGRISTHTAPEAGPDLGSVARRPEWPEQVGERAEGQAILELSRIW